MAEQQPPTLVIHPGDLVQFLAPGGRQGCVAEVDQCFPWGVGVNLFTPHATNAEATRTYYRLKPDQDPIALIGVSATMSPEVIARRRVSVETQKAVEADRAEAARGAGLVGGADC